MGGSASTAVRRMPNVSSLLTLKPALVLADLAIRLPTPWSQRAQHNDDSDGQTG